MSRHTNTSSCYSRSRDTVPVKTKENGITVARLHFQFLAHAWVLPDICETTDDRMMSMQGVWKK